MMLVVALRSLLAHPVRSGVLACGFGLGVSVMAILLGVGEVILEQARSPALSGGGDVIVFGEGGRVPSARYLLSHVLGTPPLATRVSVASPTRRATLYLVRDDRVLPVRVRGGIPSLERALGDPETAAVPTWADTVADRAWTDPDPAEVLRSMDRFHPIPDVPARAASWAEWLYFNGRAGSTRFYLAFLVGPKAESGQRQALVRLQLDHGGRKATYAYAEEIDEAVVLRDAPDLTIGASRVRLDGLRYRIHLELPPHLVGDLVITAVPGRALPPFEMHGAGGWVLGYTVPVMSGALSGELSVDGVRIPLDGGVGYHDHNWSFWSGVTWQWGQVAHEGLSFVYGRVRPPADAADPARVPGVIIAAGHGGPIGYSSDVSIDEQDERGDMGPRRIVVRGRGRSLDLTMVLEVEDVERTRMDELGIGEGHDFFQLRARYRVFGRVEGRQVDFTALGSAETFRGR